MEIFGLLGERLQHSYSPQIHRLLGDYTYRLYEISPADLPQFLRRGDWRGLNITIPYKQAVLPYCDHLSPLAQTTGSVNTILRRPDNSLWGGNTDAYGFRYLLAQSSAPPSGLRAGRRGGKALVLGSGGAARTVAAVLAELGSAPVVIISRSGEDNYHNLRRHHDAALIVNATPVGMYPDNGVAPLDLSLFDRLELALDLIYNPARTELLLQAEEMGVAHNNGLAMLVAQAKAASELFQNHRIAERRVAEIAKRLRRQMMNVALIGMPGSGKSTVGRRLAKLCHRPFYDTDEMVAAAAGRPITEIFAAVGEAAFRELESAALAQVSRLSGAVIACGGGVVTRSANKRLLRQNAQVVFLQRELEDLPTAGRPLSQQRPLAELYRERLPLYHAWSDYTFAAAFVEETARRIKEQCL
ncbi:MAG: shikimate kinase [Clostridia bacterium]|nr:shikimate kinase [Clostridia bacterium]